MLTLLRRVNEQLDLRRHGDSVDDRAVILWVEGVTFKEWRGRTVLDGHDFYQDLEWAADDRPRALFALRVDERLTLPGVHVTTIHRWSQGWEWEVIAPEQLPEPPFLLTDEVNCRSVFRGAVLLRPTSWACDEIARRAHFESAVPVLGERWFGVVRVDASDRSRGHLEAFSREGVRLARGAMDVKWAGEDHEFGQIVMVSPSGFKL